MSLPAPDLPAVSASDVSAELPEILLIDDEVPFRELIAHFLRTRGYRVHEAGDGEQALRFLSGHPVGLIVSDVCMPNCDGIELLTELRCFSKWRRRSARITRSRSRFRSTSCSS